MAWSQHFMGVENEFISFQDGRRKDMEGLLEGLKVRSDRFNDYEDLWSVTGHKYYVDESELEMCTPPVAVNKGFASRLTDLVLIGRNRIVDKFPDLVHTG